MNKNQIEQQMADWLAHPMEFGVRPELVRFKRTYMAELNQRRRPVCCLLRLGLVIPGAATRYSPNHVCLQW